jgi:hypothetical protein
VRQDPKLGYHWLWIVPVGYACLGILAARVAYEKVRSKNWVFHFSREAERLRRLGGIK